MPRANDVIWSYNQEIDNLIAMCQVYERTGSDRDKLEILKAYEYKVLFLWEGELKYVLCDYCSLLLFVPQFLHLAKRVDLLLKMGHT